MWTIPTLNTRETATVFWLAALVAFSLIRPSVERPDLCQAPFLLQVRGPRRRPQDSSNLSVPTDRIAARCLCRTRELFPGDPGYSADSD